MEELLKRYENLTKSINKDFSSLLNDSLKLASENIPLLKNKSQEDLFNGIINDIKSGKVDMVDINEKLKPFTNVD